MPIQLEASSPTPDDIVRGKRIILKKRRWKLEPPPEKNLKVEAPHMNIIDNIVIASALKRDETVSRKINEIAQISDLYDRMDARFDDFVEESGISQPEYIYHAYTTAAKLALHLRTFRNESPIETPTEALFGKWLISNFESEFIDAYGKYLSGPSKPVGQKLTDANSLYEELITKPAGAVTVFTLH